MVKYNDSSRYKVYSKLYFRKYKVYKCKVINFSYKFTYVTPNCYICQQKEHTHEPSD